MNQKLVDALELLEYYGKDPRSNECPSPDQCTVVVQYVRQLERARDRAEDTASRLIYPDTTGQ